MTETIADCSDENKSIHLTSKDGTTFAINMKTAKKSTVIALLLNDTTVDPANGPITIPLPIVGKKELQVIIAFLENHKNDSIDAQTWHQNLVKGEVSSSDKKLMEMDGSSLTELIFASDYMDIAPLTDLVAWATAQQIKTSKSPEEIQQKFAEDSDFTAEETKALMEEYKWFPIK